MEAPATGSVHNHRVGLEVDRIRFDLRGQRKHQRDEERMGRSQESGPMHLGIGPSFREIELSCELFLTIPIVGGRVLLYRSSPSQRV